MEEILYCEVWWDVETGCPEKFWMPYLRTCSRPVWKGLWTTWSSGCQCGWNRIFKDPLNPNYSVIMLIIALSNCYWSLWFLWVHKSFISIPILTLNIERGTVTSWHGIHSSALLLNLPLQLLWHPHPHQVKYSMVENVLTVFPDVLVLVFPVIARGCALMHKW